MRLAAFVVPGAPQPKPRPRVTSRGTFMPTVYTQWRETVKDAAGLVFGELDERGEPWDAHAKAYGVSCRFFVERADRGDADNLAGGVLDALNAFAWADDRLVVDLRVTKAIDKVAPRVEVELRVLEAA